MRDIGDDRFDDLNQVQAGARTDGAVEAIELDGPPADAGHGFDLRDGADELARRGAVSCMVHGVWTPVTGSGRGPGRLQRRGVSSF